MDHWRWRTEHSLLLVPGLHYLGQLLATFKVFPPRQATGSFNVDGTLRSLQQGSK
jgi:hypothetical protein